jgi:hypothetical protein
MHAMKFNAKKWYWDDEHKWKALAGNSFIKSLLGERKYRMIDVCNLILYGDRENLPRICQKNIGILIKYYYYMITVFLVRKGRKKVYLYKADKNSLLE